MVFSSLTFVFAFFPIVVIVYYILIKTKKIKNFWLFIASLVFYSFCGVFEHILLLIGCIIFNYIMALVLQYSKEKSDILCKAILATTIVCDLSILVYYKYFNFLLSHIFRFSSDEMLGSAIALPIGISFYIFQTISYIIDVYRGEKAEKNLCNMGLYIIFFAQLVAGPIIKFKDISTELNERKETFSNFCEGVFRFIVGFIKKVLLANTLGELADIAFVCDNMSVCFAWLGAIAYSLQIFYDFSGYSDMAIGIGRIFGFHFAENFNYPYVAKTITDFWRRWHISLSTFFKEYLYIPLGGSRVKVSRQITNLAIVWTATGIWHGANWTFVVWGILFFLLLILEKYFVKPWRFENKIGGLCYRILTIIAIIMLWVVFRAESISKAIEYLRIMIGIGEYSIINDVVMYQFNNYFIYLFVGVIAAFPIYKIRGIRKITETSIVRSGIVVSIIVLFAIAVAQLMVDSYNPFIYYMF